MPSTNAQTSTISVGSSTSSPASRIVLQVSCSFVFFLGCHLTLSKCTHLIESALCQHSNVHLIRQLVSEQSDLSDRDSGEPFFGFFLARSSSKCTPSLTRRAPSANARTSTSSVNSSASSLIFWIVIQVGRFLFFFLFSLSSSNTLQVYALVDAAIAWMEPNFLYFFAAIRFLLQERFEPWVSYLQFHVGHQDAISISTNHAVSPLSPPFSTLPF